MASYSTYHKACDAYVIHTEDHGYIMITQESTPELWAEFLSRKDSLTEIVIQSEE